MSMTYDLTIFVSNCVRNEYESLDIQPHICCVKFVSIISDLSLCEIFSYFVATIVHASSGVPRGGAQGAQAPPSENLNRWPEKLLTL